MSVSIFFYIPHEFSNEKLAIQLKSVLSSHSKDIICELFFLFEIILFFGFVNLRSSSCFYKNEKNRKSEKTGVILFKDRLTKKLIRGDHIGYPMHITAKFRKLCQNVSVKLLETKFVYSAEWL